jgi:hypothetical protein
MKFDEDIGPMYCYYRKGNKAWFRNSKEKICITLNDGDDAKSMFPKGIVLMHGETTPEPEPGKFTHTITFGGGIANSTFIECKDVDVWNTIKKQLNN